jgi:hypothetical protein
MPTKAAPNIGGGGPGLRHLSIRGSALPDVSVISQNQTLIVCLPACVPMAFFDSDIVQEEARRLFTDYQQLMQLGSDYGKFDREGKKLFIDRMEEMMDRYRVFMKRFELSEDFQAKLTVEQLRTQLGQFGLTPDSMFQQLNQTLERMKSELGNAG